jgi:hypothetical protein
MGRGASRQATRGFDTTQGIGATREAEAQGLRSTLVPGYTSLLNQGYTPEQKAGMTTAGMGAAAAPFETAALQSQNEAARTRNTAGTAAQEDALARSKGETLGSTAAGLQKGFADQEQSNRLAGLSGLQSVYGTDTGAMASMYGLGPEYVNARTRANEQTLANTQAILGGLYGAGSTLL